MSRRAWAGRGLGEGEVDDAAWFTGNPAIVQLLLQAGADPQAVNNEGLTPLHQSAAGGASGRVIVRLLAAGADPLAESNDGRTPLHSALRYAVVCDVISPLVQGGGAANLTPLQLAALEGDAAAVTSLRAGAADGQETLRKLREKAEREKVDKAMKRVGRMAIVGLFLVSAADLSAQEWSPWKYLCVPVQPRKIRLGSSGMPSHPRWWHCLLTSALAGDEPDPSGECLIASSAEMSSSGAVRFALEQGGPIKDWSRFGDVR